MAVPTSSETGRRKRGRPPAKGKSKRKDLNGGRSRDSEVVAAAVRLFYSKGYAATSIQDVADELGLLKGSLYYYIDTKETLLRRIFETSHEQVQTIAEKYKEADGPALERFQGFLKEYTLWYLRNIPRASLFAREWRHAGDELRAVMLEQRRYYDHTLRELIFAVGEEHEFGPVIDASMISNFIMSAVSSVPDWFHPDGSRSAEDVASLYVEYATRVLIDGKSLAQR
ncbi:TetR/AcrR family transcriptional regulator [Rhodococcus rhodochrous]|uniref:TetR/AcrR family transcriptional regulator n=1 Tax=Rhodococcus rhodochrous TaxID=1829 RepID=UPI001E519444|nr:TetR/AcrR family transcriptional regulator [Rhodococcus rhodochrous]MCD2100337.1 TetR/AcrR family transcriptional regulator [Rhodococcus rhodochrous]MCD2124668.1 TetR/AcrR family transcriptional regulator [Rhodococcus rhodochrous]MCQ4137995.1 TetR/AcrR family transcriptional regulator [Rhodococcus rhodochrous]MDJ0021549.1 TetR/AcrR family transcriptional regulator [Rhodococcus rhodochrous]